MTARQTNREQRLSGVEGGGEDVRLERQRASVLEHFDLEFESAVDRRWESKSKCDSE